MIINIVLILIFFALLIGGIYYFSKKLKDSPKETIDEQVGERISEEQQIDKVAEQFDSLIKEDLSLLDLDEKSYKEKENTKAEVLMNLDLASKGNLKAREFIKGHIYSMIDEGKTGLNSKNVNLVIRFDDIRQLKSRDMFEIAHHVLTKKYEKNLNDLSKEDRLMQKSPTRKAMAEFIESNNLHRGAYYNGEIRHIITKDRLYIAFVNTMLREGVLEYGEYDADGNPVLSQNGLPKLADYRLKLDLKTKYEILAQRIYEEYKGFSSADIFLSDSGVDEVDGGVSGIPETGFTFKMLPNMQYSHEHLWIVWNGTNILLESYGFGKLEAEGLQRVCNIIYKNNPPHALTEDSGFVACAMADDTRIVVTMPPFGEDYAFFARKHDTAKGFKPENLINADEGSAYTNLEGCIDTIKLLKWSVKGKRNIIVSGEQNTGKTTFIKMLFNFVDEDNIRVNEMMAELGLRYAFPTKNIFSMQATSNVSMQTGIDISKKMNGGVQILGEISESILTVMFSQLCSRGGSQAYATFHGKDTDACIKSMGQDLVECNVATSLADGMAKISEILNINIHLDNDRPKIDIATLTDAEKERYANMGVDEDDRSRHIGFIDEVVPLIGTKYPYPNPKTQEEMWQNTTEYYMRETDRVVYQINRLIEYKDKKLVVRNIFTDETCDKIASKLSRRDELEFWNDMEKIKSHIVA